MLLRVSAPWDCKRNFLLHKSTTSFSLLSLFLSSFQFLFHFFVFPSHTFFFIISEPNEKVAARCFFFSYPTGTLKHSQNLSTGVSHSSSNCGTVKTDNCWSFDFFNFFFPSSLSLIWFQFHWISVEWSVIRIYWVKRQTVKWIVEHKLGSSQIRIDFSRAIVTVPSFQLD